LYKRLKDYEGNSEGLFTDLLIQKKDVNSEMVDLAETRGETMNGPVQREMPKKFRCDYRNFTLSCGHNVDLKVYHYRSGSYSCSICYNTELSELAKKKGLELVSTDLIGIGNRLYMRKCGHTVLLSHSRIKDKYSLSCSDCLKDELDSSAKANNFSYKHIRLNDYIVTFNKCSHSIKRSRKSLVQGCTECSVCRQETYKVEALSVGMTLLDDIPTGANRLYLCNTCGHKEVFSLGSIRLQHIRCDKCYHNTKVSDAEKAGLIFCGEPSNKKIGFNSYELPCGCTKDLRFYDVRMGDWLCHTHQETYYNHPNNLYVFEITSRDFSWLKVGFAKKPESRLLGYGLEDGYTYKLLFNRCFETTYETMLFEKHSTRSLVKEN